MAQSHSTTGVGDSKGGGLGRTFQKTVNRTKEKMMQSIGRKDKTSDGGFDLLAITFTEQQSVATRLNSEYRNYIKQVKALMAASESMQLAIRDAYESQWPDSNIYYEFGEKLKENWLNYIRQLEDSQAHFTRYVDQFDDLKQRIAKRSRKKTYYDSARHTVESLEAAKKRDTFKLTKAESDMEMAKQVYTSLNHALQTQLREFYDSRVPSICKYLSSLFEAEATFLNDASEMKRQLASAAKNAAETRPKSFGSYSNSSTSSFTKHSANSRDGATAKNDSSTIGMLATRSVSNDYEALNDYEQQPLYSKPSYSRQQILPVSLTVDNEEELKANFKGVKVVDSNQQSKVSPEDVKVDSIQIKLGHEDVKVDPIQVNLGHEDVKVDPIQVNLGHEDVKVDPIQVNLGHEDVKVDPIQVNFGHEDVKVDHENLKVDPVQNAEVLLGVTLSLQSLPNSTTRYSSSSSLVADPLIGMVRADGSHTSLYETSDEIIEVEKIEIMPPKLVIDSKQGIVVEEEDILRLSNQVKNISQHENDTIRLTSNGSQHENGTIRLTSNGSQHENDTIRLTSNGSQHENDTIRLTSNGNFDVAQSSRVKEEHFKMTNSTAVDCRVKYQVVALYDYSASDEDELSFKAGEIMNIIDLENLEEMDEGWLMGVRVLTGEKGILPENFTKRFN